MTVKDVVARTLALAKSQLDNYKTVNQPRSIEPTSELKTVGYGLFVDGERPFVGIHPSSIRKDGVTYKSVPLVCRDDAEHIISEKEKYADSLVETLTKIALYLGIDFDKAEKFSGTPSELFIQHIDAKTSQKE